MRALLFLLCLCTIVQSVQFVQAQPPTSEEAAWQDFLAWLRQAPANSRPGDLIQSYRESLAKKGLPKTETERRMGVVSDFIFTRRKGVELLWDKVYAGANPIFLQTPSAVVRNAIEGLKPGRALDIGMGQGRNSVYLAARGWVVTGFDPSTEGVRIARSNAERAGVKMRALVARDDEFPYGEGEWDLIVMTYVRDLNDADAKLFWKALKPGGTVAYENGADEDNSVLKAFLGYQIIRFEDIVTTPDWNPDHRTRMQRLIARKTLR